MGDLKGFGHDLWSDRKAESDLEWETDHPLADVFHWQNGVDQMSRRLAHAPSAAAGAEAALLTAKRDQVFELARLTLGSQESMSQDPASQVLIKLFDHEIW